MPHPSLLSLALAAALLAGCAQPPASPGSSPPAAVACQPGPAQFAVGQVATQELLAQAQRRAGAARARVLRPDQVVTMEFDAQRLNLDVDQANRVLRARCG